MNGAMIKPLLFLIMSGALAQAFVPASPPLLIDSAPAAPVVTLDVGD
jgi:hypothetical protein